MLTREKSTQDTGVLSCRRQSICNPLNQACGPTGRTNGQLQLPYRDALSKLLAGGKGEGRKLGLIQGNIFGLPGRSAEDLES